MTISLANIVAYSLQLAAITVAALVTTRLLRLRAPVPSLRFWQAILIISIAAPFVQPSPMPAGALLHFPATAALASPSPMDAVTTMRADAAEWLLMLIAAGIVINLAWLALGLARLARITRRAERTTHFDALLRDLAPSLDTAAAIAISDDVETPATVGTWRPVVLVPRTLLSMPERVQRAVIAHELTHVRRRDWLVTVLEQCWCALLWFHPAARSVTAHLSLAREMVVDQATLQLTRDRRGYAEALLAFATPQPNLPGVVALIRRRQLSQRISLIAQEDVMTGRRLLVSLSFALLVVGGSLSAAVSAFPLANVAPQSTVYTPGNGVSLPEVIEEFKPDYTREAMQQGIQGSVWMAVVVGATGDVTDVAVTTSLDDKYGLDEQAVESARRWKFKPGMKDGKPVAVRVTIQMTFTLK